MRVPMLPVEREDGPVKRRHHTPEQIVRKIAEGDKMLNAGSVSTVT